MKDLNLWDGQYVGYIENLSRLLNWMLISITIRSNIYLSI
jgi:hypothetical protein